MELIANHAIEVSELQVSAQPGPTGYVKTQAQSGVYNNVRFAADQLGFTTNGPNDTAMTVRLITTG